VPHAALYFFSPSRTGGAGFLCPPLQKPQHGVPLSGVLRGDTLLPSLLSFLHPALGPHPLSVSFQQQARVRLAGSSPSSPSWVMSIPNLNQVSLRGTFSSLSPPRFLFCGGLRSRVWASLGLGYESIALFPPDASSPFPAGRPRGIFSLWEGLFFFPPNAHCTTLARPAGCMLGTPFPSFPSWPVRPMFHHHTPFRSRSTRSWRRTFQAFPPPSSPAGSSLPGFFRTGRSPTLSRLFYNRSDIYVILFLQRRPVRSVFSSSPSPLRRVPTHLV